MDNFTLDKCMNKILFTTSGKGCFLGVLPANHLECINKPFKGMSIILNTDEDNKGGQHWVCFYVNERMQGEFFDSFGNSPAFYHLYWQQWFEKHFQKNILINPHVLQSPISFACGAHCLFYLFNRYKKISPTHILNRLYTTDLSLNDEMVTKMLYKKYDPHNVKSTTLSTLKQSCTCFKNCSFCNKSK